jgi:hypothetical protein
MQLMHGATLKSLDVPITPLEGQVSWALGKVQVRPISPTYTAVFSGFSNRCFYRFFKPRL